MLPVLNRPTTVPEIVDLFGSPGLEAKGDRAWQAENVKLVTFPHPLPLSWDTSQIARRARVHRHIAPLFTAAFREIEAEGHWALITSWGGSYAHRRIRGARRRLSLHSWGIAFDLNTTDNPMGSHGQMPKDLIDIFESYGFYWGGFFRRPDPMHFQFAKGV